MDSPPKPFQQASSALLTTGVEDIFEEAKAVNATNTEKTETSKEV